MVDTVVIDARDAVAQPLRGWGRYAACLVAALEVLPDPGLRIEPWAAAPPGPEILYEQLLLPWRLRRRNADLIHVTNCFLPLIRPCPGVVTIHDLAFEAWPEDFAPRTRWKYRTLARRAARSAQAVIVPSEFTAHDLTERYGTDPARVHVIAEAPALPESDLAAPPGPYVLAVGDLRRKKNLTVLVEAFALLHRRGAVAHRLVLAGLDSGEGPELVRRAGGAAVELTGYLEDRELDALIRGADLLVHPSVYEGFGLVVLEAMARGVPVLAAGATALTQTGGAAARYFDPAGGSEALAAELEALLGDAGLRQELAHSGCEHAAGFSWERAATQTLAVYRSLL